MKTAMKQANFQIHEDLLNELRATVGKGELSRFVSKTLKRELHRLRQLEYISFVDDDDAGIRYSDRSRYRRSGEKPTQIF